MIDPGSVDLTTHLLALATRQPSAPAFFAAGRAPMTFEELAARIRATGQQLASWGIRRGDVVAWPAVMRAETVAALAIMPSSSTFVTMAPGLTVEAYVALLQRLHPKAVAAPAGSEHAIIHAARQLGVAEIAVVPVPNGAAGSFDLELSRPQRSLESASTLSPEIAQVSATSGTTGRPKLVPHGHRQIMTIARFTGERLAMGPGDVSAHLMPLHVTGGIRSAHFLSLLNGGAVACLPEAGVDEFLAAVERDEITYLSTSFTIIREILRRAESGHRLRRGRLRFVRVASGRLEPEEMDRLASALGVPVVTGLALSEAGMPAHQRLPPAPRNRGSVGPPLGGEVRLVDERGCSVAPGERGEIQVRGPQVFAGYLDDPELNAEAFVDGWFRTGDLGRFDADGELYVVGRIKEMVNRGGEKISPAEVDAVLRTIRGVADAAAFGVPHPALGEELVAAVVRERGSDLDARDVIAKTRAQLGPRRAPRQVWFVDTLPRNDAGKVLRRSLPEWVGHKPAGNEVAAARTPPSLRSPIEIALASLWARTLGLQHVGTDDEFFMLGGDSLRGAQLLDEVLAVFGVALPTDALFDDAGTVSGMASRIEGARARGAPRAGSGTISRRAAEAVIPLSSAQARTWFLQRLDPESAAYHEPRVWRIEGDLDVDALRAGIASVATRQPMLRTRFVTVGAEPRQVIDGDPVVDLEELDLSDGAEPEDERLQAAVRERVARPFDMAVATPLRWTLFTLGPSRHALLRVMHHILGDALSTRILQAELSEAYEAARGGRSPALPSLLIDYGDYSVWQAREHSGEVLERNLEFWKSRLADLPVLALPADRRRPATQSFHGATVLAQLSSESAAALKAIGREHGATPFMSFLTAFSVLLSRLSGETDLAIGTTIAGRTLPELAHVIGFFANTVVFRADLAGAPSTIELLVRTRERVREAILHQDTPFDKVVDALGVSRDPSRNPLYQVAFALREHDAADLQLSGTEMRRIDVGLDRSKFDLAVRLIEWPDRIEMRWEYCTDLFDRATIERMSRQYATLVDAMAKQPTRPVEVLSLLTPSERQQILFDWNATGADEGEATTVDRLFAAQVARTPSATALIQSERQISYSVLNERANQLAHHMRALGVGPEVLVAVCLERSLDLVIAIIAILKAGGSYVPLNPGDPAERIEFMLQDAQPLLLVTQKKFSDRHLSYANRTLLLDSDWQTISSAPVDDPQPSAAPENIAYVIYTSGSTGRPKGVLIEHRSLTNYMKWTMDTYYHGQNGGSPIVHSISFDGVITTLFGPLLCGQPLILPEEGGEIDAICAGSPSGGRFALTKVTPSHLRLVNRALKSGDVECPTTALMIGGESLVPEDVAYWQRRFPEVRLINHYGPTEATVGCCTYEIEASVADLAGIPIGRPIRNTRLYILDSHQSPVPPGVNGELYIAGAGVARGYLRRPELTAERFIADPFSATSERMYRTGDLARWRIDGVIELVGRNDRQVKIRGHRIELEEVEATIARLPEVRAAAVALHGDTSDTRELVAYVVAADASGPPPANLWARLKAILPEYMLPASIVWLKSLPLNASGKIDRHALRAIEDKGSRRTGARVAPRDMFEQVLAGIWQRLLGTAEIGVFDHFFEIGGHSLLAARLFDEIECETGVTAPLAAIFRDDTIAGLARALRERPAMLDAPIVPINDSGKLPPLVFLHGDLTGGGFYSRSLAQTLGPDQPMLVVQPHGLDNAPIPGTIEAMAEDRVKALKAVRPHGPYMVGGYCNGAFVAFEMARQLVAQGDDVPLVIVIEARAPSAVTSGAGTGGEAYISFDHDGGIRTLAPRDRATEAQLRYSQAMDRYAGGRYQGHLVFIRPGKLDGRERDVGWTRFAASSEIHVLPGDHVTLVTHHIGELARAIQGAILRVRERVIP